MKVQCSGECKTEEAANVINSQLKWHARTVHSMQRTGTLSLPWQNESLILYQHASGSDEESKPNVVDYAACGTVVCWDQDQGHEQL